MTELFRDQAASIAFDLQNATPVSATFYKNGAEVSVVNGAVAPIPYSLINKDGEFQVEWAFTVTGDAVNTYTRVESYTVVTPIFSKAELEGYNAKFVGISDDDYRRYERISRKAIETATGQVFGYYKGGLLVNGNGSQMLRLPYRAIRVTGLTSPYGQPSFEYLPRYLTELDGFYLRIAPELLMADSIKVPAYEEWVSTGAIGYPTTKSFMFQQGTLYGVYGEFGWASVPDDVKEAGLVLAEMYSCKDAAWRDRYLKTIRSSEWTFTYDDRAYRSTGSALADSLLAPYAVPTMAVI